MFKFQFKLFANFVDVNFSKVIELQLSLFIRINFIAHFNFQLNIAFYLSYHYFS